MINYHEENTQQMEIVSVDSLVPKDHLVRKLKKYIDFNFIYDLVRPYYSENEGRPSVDPIILFKILFIRYIFGIKSIRQTIKDIEVNVAYRWFLGLSLNEKVPHFTLISTNYNRRFKDSDVFEKIFTNILNQAIDKKMIDMKEVYIDSTHVKANANKKKFIKEEIKKEKKSYEEELFEDVNRDRIAHGKKPFKKKEKDKTETKKISTTDPESGYFVKGEKERIFAYSAHTAVDNKGMVIGVKVTPGNVHDSQAFFSLYEDIKSKYNNDIQAIIMDAGYKTPAISKKIFDDNKLAILPYKRPMTKRGFFKKYEYIYDKEKDRYICPNKEELYYTTTDRNGYRIYKSNSNKCKECALRSKCTKSKNHQKIIAIHIWDDYLKYAEDLRKTEYHKIVYKRRKETVERCFGDGKENNTLRYTRYKGIKRNQDYISLLFACMNMKKIALWSSKKEEKTKRYP